MRNNYGQSLLELVIALGLLTVVITVLAIATVNGLKNSQFSKNQAQATKLAQEGMEKIRTIRGRNYTVCGPVGVTSWAALYTVSTSLCSSAPECTYVLQNMSQAAASPCTSTEYWLNSAAALASERINVDNTTFERQIKVRDYQSDITQKEVTVMVSWTDISGQHSSKLTTILVN